MSAFTTWLPQWTFVNCWHQNDHESAAMWKLYSTGQEAVAMVSTSSRLEAALPGDAYLGLVSYIDYETEWMPENNTFYPYVHKRRSFEHECEVRAIIQKPPSTAGRLDIGRANPEQGTIVPVIPDELIAAVYVAPTAAEWFVQLVGDIVTQYDCHFPVRRSRLTDPPVF